MLVWPPPPDNKEAPWVSIDDEWTAPEYEPLPDPWIMLAGVATRTSTIQLGAGSEYTELCKKLGATWLLTTTIGESGSYSLDKQRIQDGPPR